MPRLNESGLFNSCPNGNTGRFLSGVRSSANRFALVLQGEARPTVGEGNGCVRTDPLPRARAPDPTGQESFDFDTA